jgi:hypothetical protein
MQAAAGYIAGLSHLRQTPASRCTRHKFTHCRCRRSSVDLCPHSMASHRVYIVLSGVYSGEARMCWLDDRQYNYRNDEATTQAQESSRLLGEALPTPTSSRLCEYGVTEYRYSRAPRNTAPAPSSGTSSSAEGGKFWSLPARSTAACSAAPAPLYSWWAFLCPAATTVVPPPRRGQSNSPRDKQPCSSKPPLSSTIKHCNNQPQPNNLLHFQHQSHLCAQANIAEKHTHSPSASSRAHLSTATMSALIPEGR